MKTKKQIISYVKQYAGSYDIELDSLLPESDDEKVSIEEYLFYSNQKVNQCNLEALGMKLGLTPNEILECDEKATTKYKSKYKFFDLKFDFEIAERISKVAPGNAENLLINAIFNTNKPVVMRGTPKDVVKKRLLEKLKDRAKYFPSEYHENAEIINLSVFSDTVIDYPDVEELIKAFLFMVDNAKESFFRIVSKKALNEEIREYNFLVTVLGLTDFALHKQKMYSNWIDEIRDIIIKEDFRKFCNYVRVDKYTDFRPWRCRTFVDNKELADKYIEVFCRNKIELIRYIKTVESFLCTFNWSDDPKNPYDEMSDEEWLDMIEKEENNCSLDEPIENFLKIEKLSECAPREVYVPKTECEIGADKEFIDKLKRFAEAPQRKTISPNAHLTKRTIARVEALKRTEGGNLQ